MRFDDRLLTVLNQPAEDRHDAAVRWRQLVDLVARAGVNSGSPVVADALDAIRREAAGVDEPLRAAAARAVAALPLPLALLEYFASDTLAVSAPVLAAASLDASQWRALRAGADDETRRFIDTLHPEIESAAVHPPAQAQQVLEQRLSEAGDEVAPAYMPPSLHEVVERIEQRRRQRAAMALPSETISEEPAAPPSLFRWECGPSGEIAWVDGAPRGALIGRSLARPSQADGDQVAADLVRAFTVRAPFRDAHVEFAGEGPVAGAWKVSGVPAFETADGRFAGYRGVALRDAPAGPSQPPPAGEELPDVLADPAALRELVHEIKTPLNAIIGFAEIIEGQYLGPADRGYRDRAAEIVRQARLLLSAIDDLDFAAKIHAAQDTGHDRVDLDALVDQSVRELHAIAARHGAVVDVARARGDVPARVEPELADRLLVRVTTSLLALAEAGERLTVTAEIAGDKARIAISRPAALRGVRDAELFEGNVGAARAGFSLRLVRGLAQIAGGELAASRDWLLLAFPRA